MLKRFLLSVVITTIVILLPYSIGYIFREHINPPLLPMLWAIGSAAICIVVLIVSLTYYLLSIYITWLKYGSD